MKKLIILLIAIYCVSSSFVVFADVIKKTTDTRVIHRVTKVVKDIEGNDVEIFTGEETEYTLDDVARRRANAEADKVQYNARIDAKLAEYDLVETELKK